MRIRRKKTLIEQAADYVEAAMDAAREKAGPMLADARDKAGPALADARDKAAPLLAQGAAVAADKAAAAASLAAEKAAEGRDIAVTKVNELRGEPPKKHRLRKLLLITGLAALLGFAAKKMRSGSGQDDWQSSYTPTPPPAPKSASDTPIFDAAQAASDEEPADEGGASPDEAIADSTEEEHPVTTPDEPAEVVDLEPGQAPVEKPASKP
jgi:hypothetical protein